MPTHFWLRSTSVPLTLQDVSELSENEARTWLAKMRWGSSTEQSCPACRAVDSHYFLRTRNQWRCKHCKFTFSVTTKTPFADRKVSCKKLVLAMFAFVMAQKGLPALELKRIIGSDYRTCFTLLAKIRFALTTTIPQEKLYGVVEIDGSHFSGRPRKKRQKPEPEDPAIPKKYQEQHRQKVPRVDEPFHPNRRLVITLRESGGYRYGASRTIVAICKSENSADINALVQKWVEVGSTIRTDELSAYGNLKYMGYKHETVNHSVEFSTDKRISQNQAESYFSRMQRSCLGIYHRITPKYMLDYAVEMAWREDMRHCDTHTQFDNLAQRILSAGVSKDWVNYSHGHKREAELLFVAPPIST